MSDARGELCPQPIARENARQGKGLKASPRPTRPPRHTANSRSGLSMGGK